MYQALLASGSKKLAAKLLQKIPTEDDHVWCVIKACQQTYGEAKPVKTKGKKKKKAMRATLDLLDRFEPKSR